MKSETHHTLLKYFNGACFAKSDYLKSLFSARASKKKYAGLVIEHYTQFKASNKDIVLHDSKNVSLDIYKGKNHSVLKMMEYLEKHAKDQLFGAYLHGSLASQEEVSYSDYDALVILKDAVFKSKRELLRTNSILATAQKIMHEYDPLQHHGWFILTESMLNEYPISYFPPILFDKSTSLLQNQGLKIEIKYNRNTVDYVAPFNHLSESLLIKLRGNTKPNNMFYLKSLLSEFMLLPALYYQAKHNNGILKKDSFALAGIDFENNDWEIMNRVSLIREEWSYDISYFQKTLLSNKNQTIRKLSRRIAPSIPQEMLKVLTSEFYKSMINLTELMKVKIDSKG